MRETNISIAIFAVFMVIVWSFIAISAMNWPMKAVSIIASIFFGSLLATVVVAIRKTKTI